MDTKRRRPPLTNTAPLVADKSHTSNDLSPRKSDLDTQANSNLASKQVVKSSPNKSSQVSYRIVPLTSTAQNSSNFTPTTTSGQVLVMMPNNREVLNQNVYIKRSPEDSFSKTVVEQKRRMMHKEIERRRRDKINDWIYVLSKQVPDCASDRTKQGQSKGGILAKTSKYIQELQGENDKVNTILKEKDDLNKELERVRQQFLSIEAENQKLMSLLQENNIPIN